MRAVYDRTIEKSCGFLFARWSAGAKAFESYLPPDKQVISDPLGGYYAGKEGMKIVGLMQAINPSIRKAIVLRARFIDDYARHSLDDGFEQVVLLGAGYDSRFLRLPEFRSTRIYELDLLSTQVIKKSMTLKLLGSLPANVTYVSIDFSCDSISQKLLAAGFQRHRKTLFIWEGVTLFLNQDILEKTLGRIADICPDSRIVFDFVPTELINDETDYKGNRMLIKLCADIKEPLTFGCQPKKMTDILTGLGYNSINITSMREANRIYSGTDKIEDSYYFATAEIRKIDSSHNLIRKSLSS
ncbi:MAG: class I SAM-dependent methyltransferase [Candidatus Zixiibacteriota bacterium]|nr:MAG: class I SAM-dependent methyltransferase [candidate division Zixibacteria bacterium]